jgi:hypothetical protein
LVRGNISVGQKIAPSVQGFFFRVVCVRAVPRVPPQATAIAITSSAISAASRRAASPHEGLLSLAGGLLR